jgi:2,3-bisphosphoglycerate-dependent phosphoglycerate mutase
VQLYFIRHAQSANNALYAAGQGAQVRSHDPALTELGLRQAACLAEALARTQPGLVTDEADSQNRAGFGLTHLYCSLMVRAVATGSAVAQKLGLPLRAWLDLHEEGGLYLDGEAGERLPAAGLGRADFARHYPHLELPEDVTDTGWWTGPYEEPAARPVRARRVLAELLARHHADDRVAIISHGGFFNHLLGALVDAQPPYRLNHLMNNTGITRIALVPEGRYVVYQNRCSHLPDELVTY